LGNLAETVTRTIEAEHPEVIGYLVWTPERLERLFAVVDQVLERVGPETLELRPVLRRSVVNHLTGLGPLDPLLLDDSVTEILINRPDDVQVERRGQLEPVEGLFLDESEVLALAKRLAARAGRSLNTETPMTDARLADGSRIAVVVPPVSENTAVAIRRAVDRAPDLDDLVAQGTLTYQAWDVLQRAVQERLNIVVAGGAGVGKTHLMRLLAAAIPKGERIIVIEDVRELGIERPGTVSLEAGGRFGLHDLLVQALRMRPDRILVGEVRGGEALDLVESMATGHPGLSTVHSPGPGMDTVYRLALAASRGAVALPFATLLELILHTLDMIVFMRRTPDGVRLVDQVDWVNDGHPMPLFRRTGSELLRTGCELPW
jgi:pilus assembly protein CpaF